MTKLHRIFNGIIYAFALGLFIACISFFVVAEVAQIVFTYVHK
jgi:hypothetical protein